MRAPVRITADIATCQPFLEGLQRIPDSHGVHPHAPGRGDKSRHLWPTLLSISPFASDSA